MYRFGEIQIQCSDPCILLLSRLPSLPSRFARNETKRDRSPALIRRSCTAIERDARS